MAQQNQENQQPPRSTINHTGQGPLDIGGAEASELPDHGRGSTDTDFGKEAARKLPGQTGGVIGDGNDVGMAAMPDAAEARDHGGRKHN